MDPLIRRFLAAAAPCGPHARELAVGEAALRFEGLSERQVEGMELFWGPYLAASSGLPARRTLTVTHAGPGLWLDRPRPDELYRIDAQAGPAGVVVVSYAFAFGRDEHGAWRVALADQDHEPPPHSLENVARLAVARMAVEAGGFAMHSAGVLKEGKAWIFAGPSGSGKSTVVKLSAPAESLGDDFGIVLPTADGWVSPPLPFDNAPAVTRRPDLSSYPVAGIWKLFQGSEARVERLHGMAAVTSLSTCTAFPWTMPDLAGPILDQQGQFCEQSCYGHLTFGLDSGFWEPLLKSTE